MAQRRGSLIGSMKAVADQVAAEPASTAPTGGGVGKGEMVTTAIHVPKRTLSLLRRVSVARADRVGGRPSVSAVLSEPVEAARQQLEQELMEN